jgi:streptogrisin C
MRPKVAVGAAGAAGAVIIAVALAGPATAHPAAPQAPSGPKVASGMMHAMQRDLGLNPAQAKTRMAHEATANTANTTLRKHLGKRFGGAYYDASSGKLVVGVTRAADAAAVRAAGARPVTAKYSQTSLNSGKSRLDKVRKSAPKSVAAWFTDVKTNRLVVTAKRGADLTKVRGFAAKSGTSAVTVRQVAATARPLDDVVGGHAWYGTDFRCSVGFSAKGSDGNYMVSAGHCTGEGGNAYGDEANQNLMGPMSGNINANGDYGFVKLESSWTPTAKVEGSDQDVAGAKASAVGASICRSGSTTNWHCGTVQELNASVQYPDVTVTGLTGTNVCAEPGDSGGAFISADQAQGVTSGGSGDCTSGGTTYFQPVQEALDAKNLTLTTG